MQCRQLATARGGLEGWHTTGGGSPEGPPRLTSWGGEEELAWRARQLTFGKLVEAICILVQILEGHFGNAFEQEKAGLLVKPAHYRCQPVNAVPTAEACKLATEKRAQHRLSKVLRCLRTAGAPTR